MTHVDVPWYYATQGEFDQVYLWVFTNYVGYGIIWMLIAIAIYGTVYQKSRSYGITTFIFAMFLALVGSQLPPEAMMYYTAIVGLGLFTVIYRILR